MNNSIRASEWNSLFNKIKDGTCTPILGSEAGFASKLITSIANQWAREYDYPFDDALDIARVAQYMETIDATPKEFLCDLLGSLPVTEALELDNPYNLLCALPFPLYITTSYDDQLAETLEAYGKQPQRALWAWNLDMEDSRASISDLGFALDVSEVSPDRPVVFYLYGNYKVPHSLVLSEDDYHDMLVSLGSDTAREAHDKRVPPRIHEALAGSLLFVGHNLHDWNFRFLLRSIRTVVSRQMRPLRLTVQVHPTNAMEQHRQNVQRYLNNYFRQKNISSVYWGRPQDFIREVRQRLNDWIGVKIDEAVTNAPKSSEVERLRLLLAALSSPPRQPLPRLNSQVPLIGTYITGDKYDIGSITASTVSVGREAISGTSASIDPTIMELLCDLLLFRVQVERLVIVAREFGVSETGLTGMKPRDQAATIVRQAQQIGRVDHLRALLQP